mmetsp:Transcript_39294/g.85845  ORF Transcript_39294/g.85845 Transcript_39294/m.85845 type:complete len:105 (+) Transcript_39294:96-410(+)
MYQGSLTTWRVPPQYCHEADVVHNEESKTKEPRKNMQNGHEQCYAAEHFAATECSVNKWVEPLQAPRFLTTNFGIPVVPMNHVRGHTHVYFDDSESHRCKEDCC